MTSYAWRQYRRENRYFFFPRLICHCVMYKNIRFLFRVGCARASDLRGFPQTPATDNNTKCINELLNSYNGLYLCNGYTDTVHSVLLSGSHNDNVVLVQYYQNDVSSRNVTNATVLGGGFCNKNFVQPRDSAV